MFIRIDVTTRAGDRFRLTADGDDGGRQREALVNAAARYGMRVVFPLADAVQARKDAPPAGVDTATLAGTLRWSDPDHGWDGDWRLDRQGRHHAWTIKGVSFDEAFRNAVRGAMGALSGHPGKR